MDYIFRAVMPRCVGRHGQTQNTSVFCDTRQGAAQRRSARRTYHGLSRATNDSEVLMDVQLVSVETADGGRLDGYLRTPRTSATARLGIDVVICHHGVGSNFYAPSFFDTVGDELLADGTAILRVNNRGHDQAYQVGQRRLGAAYEVIDDCRHDFTAWLDFASAHGFRPP